MVRSNTSVIKLTALIVLTVSAVISLLGCYEQGGYSTDPLYTEDVSTVYVEMFSNRSFYRGVEYKLTDALAKRIEANTPYKIVSSRDRADSIISGYIGSVGEGVLSVERETGRPLEKDMVLAAVVSWKNLRNGDMMLESEQVTASATYSEWQNQGSDYGSSLAANKLAKRIVEAMETPW